MAKHMLGRRSGAFTLALGALTLAGCAAFAPAPPEQYAPQPPHRPLYTYAAAHEMQGVYLCGWRML